jgi:hypothetical protein
MASRATINPKQTHKETTLDDLIDNLRIKECNMSVTDKGGKRYYTKFEQVKQLVGKDGKKTNVKVSPYSTFSIEGYLTSVFDGNEKESKKTGELKEPKYSASIRFEDDMEKFKDYVMSREVSEKKEGYVSKDIFNVDEETAALVEKYEVCDEKGLRQFICFSLQNISVFNKEKEEIDVLPQGKFFIAALKSTKYIPIFYDWVDGSFERLRSKIASLLVEDVNKNNEKFNNLKEIFFPIDSDKPLPAEVVSHMINYSKTSKYRSMLSYRRDESGEIEEESKKTPTVYCTVKNYTKPLDITKPFDEEKAKCAFVSPIKDKKGNFIKYSIQEMIELTKKNKFFGKFNFSLQNLSYAHGDPRSLKIRFVLNSFAIKKIYEKSSGDIAADQAEQYAEDLNEEDLNAFAELTKLVKKNTIDDIGYNMPPTSSEGEAGFSVSSVRHVIEDPKEDADDETNDIDDEN